MRVDEILASVTDAVITIDAQQRIVLFNAAAERMFRCPAGQAIGEPIEHLIPERFREAHTEHIRRFAKDEVTRRSMGMLATVYGLRADGGEFPAEASISQVETDGKRFYTVILRDLTHRLQAENSLRDSQERLRQLVESVRAIPWEADPATWQFSYVGPQAVEILGYAVSQWLGEGFWVKHIHPEDRERAIQVCADSSSVSDHYEFEYRMLAADGRVVWIHDLVNVVRGEDGGAILLRGFMLDITARKQAEDALRLSEARNRALLNAIPDMMFRVSRDGTFLDYRTEKETDLLLPAGSIVGTNIRQAPFPLGVADRLLGAIRLALDLEATQTVEYSLDLPGGPYLFEARIVASGPAEVVSIVRNITESRKAEEALRRSEEQYRLLFESNPLPMWIFDPETLAFLAVNDSAIRHYGYTRKEFLAMTILDIRPPEAVPDLLERLPTIGQQLEYAGGWKHRKKDGTLIDVEVITHGVLFNGLEARLALLDDITERRRAEERLIEQAALLDHAQEAIIVRDLADRILFWNKSAERLYGWSAEEVIGASIQERLYREVPQEFDQGKRAVLSKGEWLGELRQTTKDGREITVESRWTLVRDSAGQPKSILVFNADITEKKKVEAQFLRAQRMESIGALAAGIAHDINNVLSPILLAIRMLQLKHKDEESQRVLGVLQKNAERGGEMVRHVLEFARGVEGQRMFLQPKHLIDEAVRILSETLPKSINLESRVEQGLWLVSGDPTQLHQVLMNLCVNARDAMPGGGKLTFAAQNAFIDESYARMNLDARPGRFVAITVTDTGIGIPNDVIDRVFEPFFTTKEFGKGTGLGLATVIGIVKGHNGFVTLSSEPGTGTEFKVFIPAVESATQPVAPEEMPDVLMGHNELILVVDDEAAVREISRGTLDTFGYRSLTAGDGTEAIALYAQHRDEVEAVVLDMMMPYMDGAATVRALHRLDPNVKIILSSGLKTSGKSAELAELGVKASLPKPYTAENLLRTLASVLATE